jgi:hypothetical protein
MLDADRRGTARVKTKHVKGHSLQLDEDADKEANRTQWTVKGIDRETLELSRKAARRRGMKFGAWVDQVLRAAATQEGEPTSANPTRELMNKIAEIESKLDQSVGELKSQSSSIHHDVRVLQLLVPHAASSR